MRSALHYVFTSLRTTGRTAIAGGMGYVLVLLATLMWAYGMANVLDALVSTQIGPFLWWALLGGEVIGAVIGVSVIQHRLISPLLSIIIFYGVTICQMWQSLHSPNPLQPGTPLDIYLIGWPLLLTFILGSGLVELRLRGRTPSSGNGEAA